jgi:nitrogen regulatory protein P-II 1
MKYIIAIIQPDRLDDVLKRLEEKEIHLVTVSNVVGRGRQRGVAEIYRSHREAGNLLKKTKLEIAVNDDYVAKTVEAIMEGARTGQTGDGKIFIMNFDVLFSILKCFNWCVSIL